MTEIYLFHCMNVCTMYVYRSFQKRLLGQPMGLSLQNKNILVLGYGAIGKALVQILRPFNCESISVVRRMWKADEMEAPENRNLNLLTQGDSLALQESLSTTDILFVACTLNDSTRNMVNEKLISNLKDGSYIVNVARGGILDYNSMMNALKSGKLGGLGLDVFWEEPFDPSDPILDFENVVFTPHVGGVTDVSYGNMAKILVSTASSLQESIQDGASTWRVPMGAHMVVPPKSINVTY